MQDSPVDGKPEGSFLKMHKSKLHCARVKQCDLHYHGSITIDQNLMEAAGMLPMEFVYIWNKNNGARIETYTIPGPRGSGIICLNGAAARNFQYDDEIIICSTRFVHPQDIGDTDQRVVILDEDNKATRIFNYHIEKSAYPSTCCENPYEYSEIDIPFHYDGDILVLDTKSVNP